MGGHRLRLGEYRNDSTIIEEDEGKNTMEQEIRKTDLVNAIDREETRVS
jgi:hypothetical protein